MYIYVKSLAVLIIMRQDRNKLGKTFDKWNEEVGTSSLVNKLVGPLTEPPPPHMIKEKWFIFNPYIPLCFFCLR